MVNTQHAQNQHKLRTKLAIERERDHLKNLHLNGMILNSGKRLCLAISVMCYRTWVSEPGSSPMASWDKNLKIMSMDAALTPISTFITSITAVCVILSQVKPHEDSEIKAILTVRSTYAVFILDVMKCSQFQWTWSICITRLHVHTTLSLSPHFTYLSLLLSQTAKPIFSSTDIQRKQKYVFKQNYYRLSPESTSLTLLYACWRHCMEATSVFSLFPLFLFHVIFFFRLL